MEKSPLLSIVIPVYNSSEYLKKAFDSVLAQDFQNFELILVNDGSTDNSGYICEEYSKKDPRIKYFSKTNGGLCSARNYGIERSRGSYIMFMDNDDEYVEGAFEIVANAIKNYGSDVIRFNRKRIQIFDNGSQKTDIYGTKGVASEEPVIYTREQFFANYSTVRRSGCFAGIWNAAFKRELFNEIRFDETITAGGEDAIVNLQIYSIFQSIAFLSDALYIYYRRTKHSISTQFQLNQITALTKEATIERQMIIKNGLPEQEYYSFLYVYIASIIKIMNHKNSRLSVHEKSKMLDELKRESYGFQFTLADIKKLNPATRIYLSMFVKGKYEMLVMLTDVIMKLRGNS